MLGLALHHLCGSQRSSAPRLRRDVVPVAASSLLTHGLISTQVITGWDQGLLGAAVGEVRKLDIPAEEGYGKGGFPAWGIPPNGGLFFEIEVLSIKGKSAEL
uniref:peptidylprolyl isomerase n=1 Tax=Pelagomonas calceolata TaxID=35677 RepID=A0A7S3ZTS6_9STRA